MAISANSYGSAGGVSALSRRWANSSGDFDTTTKPTLAQVEAWIDQVSSAINVSMVGCRYTTFPITIDYILDDFALYTNQIVAEMVAGSHDLGRLGPEAFKSKGGRLRSTWAIVAGDVQTYIQDRCDAFEYAGIPRDDTIAKETTAIISTVSVIRADGYSDDLNNIET